MADTVAIPAGAIPAAPISRPRTTVVGSVLTVAAVLMAFAGLLGYYLNERALAAADGTEWFPEGVVQLGPAGMIMTTLVMAMFTVAWLVQAAANDDRPHAMWAVGVTGLFGASVLVQLWFIYSDFGFVVDAGMGQFLFYVITAAFAALMVGAMLALILVALRILAGQYGSGDTSGPMAVAVVWFATAAVWFFVWYVVFITK